MRHSVKLIIDNTNTTSPIFGIYYPERMIMPVGFEGNKELKVKDLNICTTAVVAIINQGAKDGYWNREKMISAIVEYLTSESTGSALQQGVPDDLAKIADRWAKDNG